MTKCTCKKLNCDSSCLCNCHREQPYDEFEELVELNNGLDRLDKAVDVCIEKMQEFKL